MICPLVKLRLRDMMLGTEVGDVLFLRPSKTIMALVLDSQLRLFMADLLCPPHFSGSSGLP